MGQDPDQIRRDIEDTRARLGETVEAIGYEADVPSRVRDNINERIDTVKGTVNTVKDRVTDTVTGAVSSGKDALFGGAGNVSGALDSAGERAASAKQAVSMAAENPIGLALGALAIGFLAGLIVPVTDVERERIGPIRDEIADRTQRAISEAVDAGKSVLDDTLSAAAESAQQKGKEIVQHAATGTPLASESSSS